MVLLFTYCKIWQKSLQILLKCSSPKMLQLKLVGVQLSTLPMFVCLIVFVVPSFTHRKIWGLIFVNYDLQILQVFISALNNSCCLSIGMFLSHIFLKFCRSFQPFKIFNFLIQFFFLKYINFTAKFGHFLQLPLNIMFDLFSTTTTSTTYKKSNQIFFNFQSNLLLPT